MDSVCLFFLLGSAGQSPLHQVGQRRWERRPVLLPVWAGRAWFLRREGCELWVPQKHRNQLEGFPSSNKLPSFYVDVGFCQKSIFCIYWDDHMVFPLKFVYIVDYTDGFSNVKPTPHSWNKAHWSWCLSSVCVCVCVFGFDLLEVCSESLHLFEWQALFPGSLSLWCLRLVSGAG